MEFHTFQWKHIVFQITTNRAGEVVYRDKAHLGGPWSSVARSLSNKNLDASFRIALRKALQQRSPSS